MASEDDRPGIGLGYPLAQLARAIAGAGAGALRRADQWRRVIAGMLEGSVRVGSRNPMSGVPAWITPEVTHGGFATGALAAEGPLLRHELEELPVLPGRGTERAALNGHYLSDAGRRALLGRLADSRFRVHVPEEGALLVVSWLRAHGEPERAARVVEAITPFLGRLRFYPVPHPRPWRSGAAHLEPAGKVAERLRAVRPSAAVGRMVEALQIWTPLADRAVALFLETVEGDAPSLRTNADGHLVRGADGQPVVEGGWPCRRFSDGWARRARTLLDDHRAARERHALCGKPERPKENYARLRGYLAACLDGPALSGRDVGAIRRILASHVAAHGAPGSDRRERTLAGQARIAAAPRHHALAAVLAKRLETEPADEGVPDLADRTSPLTADEAACAAAVPGVRFPPRLVARARRCLESSPETLVAEGIVGSSETLARLVPALTARVRAASIAEPELRSLYEQVYLAFRRRRSLLLLDLEKQVRLGELPWIAAIEPWVGADQASREAARQVLVRVGSLALGAFPHAIVPNRLVTELRALSAAAELKLPLVNELAADIFMGAFSETFLRAGHAAARLLSGSLYERYYGVQFDRVLALDDVERDRYGSAASPGFARLCEDLAGGVARSGWSVARNGTIVEQAQIVTTHNLATLFSVPELAAALRPRLPELAERCFGWICRQLRTRPERPGALRTAKNAAYAWRQMVFFLSLCDRAEVERFLASSARALADGDAGVGARLEPVLDRLRAAAAGERLGPGSPIFLGWSIGPHWIFGRR